MALPVVGDVLTLGNDEAPDYRVAVVAVDLEAYVWTVVERWTDRLLLMTFDENGNYTTFTPVVETWFDDEPA